MADYKVVDTEKLESELTGMADEVRTLADTDSKMSLNAMTDNVAQANEKVDSQSEIIAQIKTALQGKAGSGGGLPDWDDDSPIIASGYGINTVSSWEITEKGTLRWKCNGTNATAGFDSIGIVSIVNYSNDFAKNAHKVKQAYVEDGFMSVGLVALPNCERIRVPDGIKSVLTVMLGLKEIDLSKINQLRDYQCQNLYSLETAVLNPLWTILNLSAFLNCVALKTINLENIIDYKTSCLSGTMSLDEVVFSAGLISIGNNAFQQSGITKAIFKPSTGSLPTIANNAFVGSGQLRNIYVPWAEGAVANAPWGATKATIHYNTQYDENGNPITT